MGYGVCVCVCVCVIERRSIVYIEKQTRISIWEDKYTRDRLHIFAHIRQFWLRECWRRLNQVIVYVKIYVKSLIYLLMGSLKIGKYE